MIFEDYFSVFGQKLVENTSGINTYGCFLPDFLGNLIKLLGIDSKSIILDIGHGHGMLLFFITILCGNLCVGVEKSSSIYKKSLELQKYLLKLLEENQSLQDRLNGVVLLGGKVSKVQDYISKFHFIFILNTKFSPEDELEILQKLDEFHFDGKIITSRKLVAPVHLDEMELFIPCDTYTWNQKPSSIFLYAKQSISNEISMANKYFSDLLKKQLNDFGMTFLCINGFKANISENSNPTIISANVSYFCFFFLIKREKCTQLKKKETKTTSSMFKI